MKLPQQYKVPNVRWARRPANTVVYAVTGNWFFCVIAPPPGWKVFWFGGWRIWFVVMVLPPLCFSDWDKALLAFGAIDEGYLALLICGRLNRRRREKEKLK